MSETSDRPRPDVRCPEWQGLIQSLVDGELDAEHSRRVEAHIAEHPACAAEMRRLTVVRERIRSAHAPLRAPDALRHRIVAGIEADEHQEAGWFGHWRSILDWLRPISLPLSGAMLAFSLVIALTFHSNPSSDLVGDLTSAHVRSLLADHLMDVATSDRHTVKPWFNGKITFSPPVVDLAAEGFPLVGGRVDYVEGRVVAALVYRHNGHVINLFIWPGTSAAPERLERGGYNLSGWQTADLVFWAVSDMSGDDLMAFKAEFSHTVQKETSSVLR